MVGAVVHGTALAQDTTRTARDSARAQADTLRQRRDSIAADSARADSIHRADLRIIAAQKRRADSIKTPTAAAEMPALTGVGESWRWDREQLFASGALTLTDLLQGVPGLTTFQSGWIGSPQLGAYLGDFGHVRVFYDGLELDPLDPRNGRMLDLSFIQLWQLEEVRIERGASEIRIHLRSWRVRSVTASTRVDVGTGDLETNGYKGYFGRRFDHGEALQVGAFQYTTRDPREGGGADQLSLFGRAGWAKGAWSVDGSFIRTHRSRDEQLRESPADNSTESVGTGTPTLKPRPNLPALDATFTDAYLRLGYTDTTHGLWAQVMAGSIAHKQELVPDTSHSADTTKAAVTQLSVSRAQYVGALGWTHGPLEVSATGRLRRLNTSSYISPMLRASWNTPRITLALFGEQRTDTKVRRIEVSGNVLPLSFLALGGAVSRYSPTLGDSTLTSTTYRAEVGLRIHRAWLSVGRLSRDTASLIAPIVFDTGFRAAAVGVSGGTFVGLRGKVWKDVGLDITAMKWDTAGAFRPQYQTRSQLYINTSWRSRFPSGNLNILAALTHEYRTAARFPIDGEELLSAQYRALGFLLEIRLITATLSYQFRNLLNEEYTQVPGFLMPRPTQFYGVRWQFFN